MDTEKKPIERSALRLKLGTAYYGCLRKLRWIGMKGCFASERRSERLEYPVFSHAVPLMRRLKDVDMWYQHNKVKNLRIAVPRVDGLILRPGQVFSYWRCIGKPSRRRGYVDGMVLINGGFAPGVGGGLCQLSNMIFWLTLHTPLTVVERHRHAYDVFPDSNRTQPFGSGATCFYPHGDLMIRNDTDDTWQLDIRLGGEELLGQWRCDAPQEYIYKVREADHRFVGQYWGGYTRHNRLYRQRFSLSGEFIDEELMVENSAVTMYSPLING